MRWISFLLIFSIIGVGICPSVCIADSSKLAVNTVEMAHEDGSAHHPCHSESKSEESEVPPAAEDCVAVAQLETSILLVAIENPTPAFRVDVLPSKIFQHISEIARTSDYSDLHWVPPDLFLSNASFLI